EAYVSGDIHINSNVGTSTLSSKTSVLDGVFSTDKSFIIEHNLSKSCPSADLRLNMSGTVIVNADLGVGLFTNNRDLCQDANYPSFYIEERPDFLLNLPSILKVPNFIWREVAP
ncbi:hypothetical protein M1307_01165, partial [Patescibacteria group bacterium]|nr:hypothetical protein [Patescibacteria group bacterium]